MIVLISWRLEATEDNGHVLGHLRNLPASGAASCLLLLWMRGPCSNESHPFSSTQEHVSSNFLLSIQDKSFPFYRIIPGTIHAFISPVIKNKQTKNNVFLTLYLPISLLHFKINLWGEKLFYTMFALSPLEPTLEHTPPPTAKSSDGCRVFTHFLQMHWSCGF